MNGGRVNLLSNIFYCDFILCFIFMKLKLQGALKQPLPSIFDINFMCVFVIRSEYLVNFH